MATLRPMVYFVITSLWARHRRITIAILASLVATTTAFGAPVGRTLAEVRANAEERDLVFSPDGRYLAQVDGRRDARVQLWSVEEERVVHRFPVEGVHMAVAFRPGGTELVTVGGVGNLDYRATIKAWDLETGEGRVIGTTTGTVTDLAFRKDGAVLVAAVGLNIIGSMATLETEEDQEPSGGHVQAWSMDDGRELWRTDFRLEGMMSKLGGPGQEVPHAAYQEAVRTTVPVQIHFRPDGRQLEAVSASGRTTVLDVATGKKV